MLAEADAKYMNEEHRHDMGVLGWHETETLGLLLSSHLKGFFERKVESPYFRLYAPWR